MTEPNSPNTGSTGAASGDTGRCGSRRGCGSGRRRGGLAVAFLLLAGAAAGVMATKAMSHGGMGHHMRHGAGLVQLAAGGPIDPSVAEARAERMARHFGVEVDASREQQEKISTIVKAAAKDLLPLRDKVQAARRDAIDLLGAATIDKAAVERIRTEQMGSADAATRRLSQAVLDIADVLSPEQRKKLADRIAAFRDHGGWGWNRG